MHSDERLREAYQAALATAARSGRIGCPDPGALATLVERSGPEAGRLALLDHVMACADCRRDLDLLRAARAAAEAATPARSWARAPSIRLVAVAATLLVVAGVSLYNTATDPEAGRRLRGGDGTGTYPARWLPGGGVVLSWRPTPDAVSYRVEVLDAAGRAVVDSTLADTAIVVADSLVRTAQPLVWTVATMLSDGSTRGSVPSKIVAPPTAR